MKTNILAAACFSLFALTAACGGDPNRQVNEARDNELKAQREANERAADRRADQRVDAAEKQRDATEANAVGPSATKDRVAADAKMKETRDVYRAKATERLEKADAKTAELKGRLDRAGAKAPTATRDSLTTIATQRSIVTRELGQLPQVRDDDFKQASKGVDDQLDTLETLVKKAESEVDKIKK